MIPANKQPVTLSGPFRAVQGDTAVTCVDWQAFHSWRADDPAFTGLVTVMDHHDGHVYRRCGRFGDGANRILRSHP